MNRAELRGKKLEYFCKHANTTTNEHGKDDNRIFCYGAAHADTEELFEICRECKAHINHIKPL